MQGIKRKKNLILATILFAFLNGCSLFRTNEIITEIEINHKNGDFYEDDCIIEDVAKNESVRIQFAGDIFIHQGPMDVAFQGDNSFDFKPFFSNISEFIDADFAIANMEVPVDARGGNLDVAGWPNFNTPFEILEAVRYAGFHHMITANNHSFDFGMEGVLNTIGSFERAGLLQTGMSGNLDDFNTSSLVEVNGFKIGIIAYTDSVNGLEHMVSDESRTYAVRRFYSDNLNSIPFIIDDMKILRELGADLVIIALHWGYEYADSPTDMQKQIARAISDAGADIIMGNHSHTVQPIEWHLRYDGSRALIMYSLGNFLADQTRLTDPTVEAQLYSGFNNNSNSIYIGRTQFGMLVTLEVTRLSDGEVELGDAHVLPTLAMRDFEGNTLWTKDAVSVMPLINGELPAFVEDPELRRWGNAAYRHVVDIIGREWIAE